MRTNFMPSKPINPLDKEQRRFIEDALREAKYRYEGKEPADPPAIRRARVMVKGYDKRRRKERERVANQFDRELHKAREEMLFGDLRKALAMVRKIRGHK